MVVRIARTVDYLSDVRTEVAAARWLEDAGFPAVRLAWPSDQPLVVDGHVVSFWELVSGDTEYGTVGELAALLRRLHSLEPPPTLELPPLLTGFPTRTPRKPSAPPAPSTSPESGTNPISDPGRTYGATHLAARERMRRPGE